jgi:hypothetical protein
MMGVFYNYIFKNCQDDSKVLDIKFYSWTGSTGGGEDRLDVGEIWDVESFEDDSINGCYSIVDRYQGDSYQGNEEISKTVVGDSFVFVNYENCDECQENKLPEEVIKPLNSGNPNTIFLHIPNR